MVEEWLIIWKDFISQIKGHKMDQFVQPLKICYYYYDIYISFNNCFIIIKRGYISKKLKWLISYSKHHRRKMDIKLNIKKISCWSVSGNVTYNKISWTRRSEKRRREKRTRREMNWIKVHSSSSSSSFNTTLLLFMGFENDKKQFIKVVVFGIELISNIRYLTKLVT